VPIGERVDSHYRYQLPTTVVKSHNGEHRYQLAMQKQAGSRPQPVAVTITLPPNTEFISAVPEATAVDDTTIQFSLTLETNTFINVVYQDK
jgi:hypothetical protein